jgi:hypothetical protein
MRCECAGEPDHAASLEDERRLFRTKVMFRVVASTPPLIGALFVHGASPACCPSVTAVIVAPMSWPPASCSHRLTDDPSRAPHPSADTQTAFTVVEREGGGGWLRCREAFPTQCLRCPGPGLVNGSLLCLQRSPRAVCAPSVCLGWFPEVHKKRAPLHCAPSLRCKHCVHRLVPCPPHRSLCRPGTHSELHGYVGIRPPPLSLFLSPSPSLTFTLSHTYTRTPPLTHSL